VVESIAYTVCGSAGLDVSGYAIPYLASWSEQAPLETVHARAAMIDRRRAIVEHAGIPEHEDPGARGRQVRLVGGRRQPTAQSADVRRRKRARQGRRCRHPETWNDEHVEPGECRVVAHDVFYREGQPTCGRYLPRAANQPDFDRRYRRIDHRARSLRCAEDIQKCGEAGVEAPWHCDEGDTHVAKRSEWVASHAALASSLLLTLPTGCGCET